MCFCTGMTRGLNVLACDLSTSAISCLSLGMLAVLWRVMRVTGRSAKPHVLSPIIGKLIGVHIVLIEIGIFGYGLVTGTCQ